MRTFYAETVKNLEEKMRRWHKVTDKSEEIVNHIEESAS